MSFSDAQLRQLKAPVRRRYVKERQADGKTLHYLEGWWVVSEANRIFGFDSWERETVSSECVWRSPVEERFAAAYLTRVRVTVRAGDRVIVREGLGGGEAIAPTPGQAHERASKAAETDATKRALSTFGSRFGLSLYGERGEATRVPHERVPLGRAAARVVKNVGERMRAAASRETTEFRRARHHGGDPENEAAATPGKPVGASEAGWRLTRGSHPFTRGPLPEPEGNAGSDADDVQGVQWASEASNEARHVTTPEDATAAPHQKPVSPDAAQHQPVEQASRAREQPSELPLFKQEDGSAMALLPVRLPSPSDPQPLTGRVDKSVLALPEPRRVRDRRHLKFVASQPCVVCARTPSQAHHLRIAQPRALGRKVSDEFTVPLCALHHHDLHMKGAEADWWWGHTIDPLPIAERLWLASRSGAKPRTLMEAARPSRRQARMALSEGVASRAS